MIAHTWLAALLGALPTQGTMASAQVEVRFPSELCATPLDGRVLVIFSTNEEAEPRFQVGDALDTQQIFGVDVEGLAPGESARIDAITLGYPLASLAEVPAGEYRVQAVLHRYETFERADGHVVKLPMDRGEGTHWNLAPGNLISTPVKARFDPRASAPLRIELDQEIPPIAPPPDTRYVKHVRIRSGLLSDFWGRDMHLGACVLLPHGFDEHPEARYPLIVNHGHFPHTFEGFREELPDPDLEPDYSARFKLHGYNRVQQELAHQLYLDWTSPDFPRFVVIQVQHANPYYDDSYAVNSQNLGPYGDAIQHELIPHVEELFRCIGEGWARFTYGGSTGGWEALAVQMNFPDEYNGAFVACPDPVDFRAYTVVDLYADENAYWRTGPWKRVPRPGIRDWLGHVSTTLEQLNQRELVLGTRSRSGEQWDIWEAVFSPVGPDGYPQPIWDKRTGVIDRAVAAHWRENYDLRHILERDWATLGPKLVGKLHIYCGTMDNYYLNDAVYLLEEFLERTSEPHYAGVVAYGERAEHCWNGDPARPNAISRLRYHQMYVPRILERIAQTAPEGADLASWRH